MPSLTHLQAGQLYSIEEIQNALRIGNAGGIRIASSPGGGVKRMALMTSIPTARYAAENPYHDRIEGETLIFTGAGREGRQTLAGLNKRIPQQFDSAFPIYGFILVGSRRDTSLGPKRWRFLGLMEYLRHYPDSQVDASGNLRSVWLFELRIHTRPEVVAIADDASVAEQLLVESRASSLSSGDDREVNAPPSVAPVTTLANDYVEVEKVRRQLLVKSPEQFEHFVKDLLVLTGFERVTVTKFSQDGGIDVFAHAPSNLWPITNLMVQVQAKRWLHSVGRKEVAELRGSLEPYARGAIVTTSHYSRAAISEASAPGKMPIVLVDGLSLASTVRRLGLHLG